MSKIKQSATDTMPAAGQPSGEIEIDLGAALPDQAPGPATKHGRGRPRTVTPKPRNPNRKVRKDKGIKKIKAQTPTAPYIDNNILNNMMGGIDYSENEETQSATKLKDKLTEKELRFINLYFTGEHSKEKAMMLAGYNLKNPYFLAGKILEKYESQAGDHRIIARALGAGEITIITGLLNLARGAKSEMVRLNAWANLAKILGLTKEQLEGAGGLTIIFEGADQRQVHVAGPGAPAAAPGSPAPEPTSPAPTYTRPLQITK